MTNAERYKLAFSTLVPQTDADTIRRLAESGKGRSSVKRMYKILILAAVLVLLAGCVVAAGLQQGWLKEVFSNAEEHPELAEKTVVTNAVATKDGVTYKINRLLAEGRVIVWELEKHVEQGNVEDVPFNPANIALRDKDGQEMNVGYSVGVRRLDDGSEPKSMRMIFWAVLTSPEHSGLEFENAELYLAHTVEQAPITDPETGMKVTPNAPVIELRTTITPFALRSTSLADGTGLRVGTCSVELQGLQLLGHGIEAAAAQAENCSLLLKTGERVKLTFSLEWSDEIPDREQWQVGALDSVIDPEQVSALCVGDTEYPLTDN